LDPQALSAIVRRPVVIDGRLCLNRVKWQDSGWTYLT
jgi:hypothetical protein